MAETRPIQRSTERIAERLDNLERRGVLVRPERPEGAAQAGGVPRRRVRAVPGRQGPVRVG